MRGHSRSGRRHHFPKCQGPRTKIALDPAPPASSWSAEQSGKMRSKNKLKRHACDCIIHHICFFSYYCVSLGVVQIVCYFKTSWSIRVIAPLNGHVKSELRWHLQNQNHIKRMICTFICSEENKHSSTQWTFLIEYVTKHTWRRYVFRVLQKSSQRYVFFHETRLHKTVMFYETTSFKTYFFLLLKMR